MGRRRPAAGRDTPAATVTITAGEFRKAARWARPDPETPLPALGDVRVSVTGGGWS